MGLSRPSETWRGAVGWRRGECLTLKVTKMEQLCGAESGEFRASGLLEPYRETEMYVTDTPFEA